MSSESILWIAFGFLILLVLSLDLGFFNRRAHQIHLKEAGIWSAVWISLAALFGLAIFLMLGPEKAITYFSGYVIEESLSFDNLFVFLVLFSYFAVPQEYRHRVLFWGVIGAVVMRATFILAGVALFNAIHWIIYVFGAFLIFTGIRVGFAKRKGISPKDNPVTRYFYRHFPVTESYRGGRFLVYENGQRLITPLLIVVIAVETTDIIFATDSIPAVLSITRDPFLAFTSNMFAVMGLRSAYFALAAFAAKLRYLKYGLSAILVFLGLKMLLSAVFEIPIVASLGFIGLVLAVSVIASMGKGPDKT